MRTIQTRLIVIILLVSSLACRAATDLIQPESSITPAATATLAPLPTAALQPTPTSEQELAPTADPEPDITATAELPENLDAALTEMPFLPMGTPFMDDSYKSIPIMPGAENATETEGALTFSIDQSTEDVLAFYKQAMPEDGWEYLGGNTEDSNGIVVIFTKGDKVATIAIMSNPMVAGTMVIIAVP
jgi:hypothetical protein